MRFSIYAPSVRPALEPLVRTDSVSFYDLHPSTSPEAIADEQRREVSRAYRRGLRTPAEIGEAIDLPASVVARRLEEIGVTVAEHDQPKPAPASNRRKLWAEVKEAIGHGPATVSTIAATIDAEKGAVYKVLALAEERGEVTKSGPVHGPWQWRLK